MREKSESNSLSKNTILRRPIHFMCVHLNLISFRKIRWPRSIAHSKREDPLGVNQCETMFIILNSGSPSNI